MKLYIPTSKLYNLPRDTFHNKEELLSNYSWAEDLFIEEIEERDYFSGQLPPEFRSVISYQAYERGHSAGQEEIDLILRGLVNDLLPAIKEFEKRIREEGEEEGKNAANWEIGVQ